MHLSPPVASTAVGSKAVVMLLLIHCLLLLPLCVGFLCLVISVFCYAVLSVPSSFAIILLRKREVAA